MRKNTQAVLTALLAGKAKHACEAIHTNGRCVKSYAENIAAPSPGEKGVWLVTDAGWSRTTNNKVHDIAYGLTQAGFEVRSVSQVEVDHAAYLVSKEKQI
jgi:hypothetical protein